MSGHEGVANASRRILIVEDEALIAVLLEEMLDDLGYEVMATASRVDEALKLVAAELPDGAILDLNVNGESALPIADALRAQGVPFIFVSGYGPKGRPAQYQDVPALEKPFQQEALRAMLELAIKSGARQER